METLSQKIIPYTLLNAEYADFAFDAHEHHTLEIVYVNRGTVQFSLFDNTPTGGGCQQVSVKSNQFVILMPWQRHCYQIREQAEVAVLELGYKNASLPLNQWLLYGEYAQKLAFSAKLFSSDRKSLIFDDTQAVFETLNKFIELVYAQQHGTRNEYFEVEYEIRLLELLVKVCRCNQLLVDRVHANRHIYNTLLYIAENYAKKISISQIAAFVNVSPSYLQRVFKQSSASLPASAFSLPKSFSPTPTCRLRKFPGMWDIQINVLFSWRSRGCTEARPPTIAQKIGKTNLSSIGTMKIPPARGTNY